MDTMGPAPAARLEPRRSEDRQPPDRQQRKGGPAVNQTKQPAKLHEDHAEVAGAEPESHQLDERV